MLIGQKPLGPPSPLVRLESPAYAVAAFGGRPTACRSVALRAEGSGRKGNLMQQVIDEASGIPRRGFAARISMPRSGPKPCAAIGQIAPVPPLAGVS
jgi:hypothetical protein